MPSKVKEVAKPIGAALLQSSSLSVSAPKLQCGTGRSKNGTTAQTRTVNRAAHHLRSKSSGRRRSADGDAGRNTGQFLVPDKNPCRGLAGKLGGGDGDAAVLLLSGESLDRDERCYLIFSRRCDAISCFVPG